MELREGGREVRMGENRGNEHFSERFLLEERQRCKRFRQADLHADSPSLIDVQKGATVVSASKQTTLDLVHTPAVSVASAVLFQTLSSPRGFPALPRSTKLPMLSTVTLFWSKCPWVFKVQ